MQDADSYVRTCASAAAQQLLPKVDEALRAVVSDKGYWQDTLTSAMQLGCFHAVGTPDKTKAALRDYHAPLAFAAEGQPEQKAPNLRLTRAVAWHGRRPAVLAQAEVAVNCQQSSVRDLTT